MKPGRNDHGAYVRKVQEGTHSFAQDLLGEIDRLRVLVAALQAAKESESDRSSGLQEVLKSNEALRALAATLEAEMNRLQEQVVTVRTELERHQKEQARLHEQLESARAQGQTYVTRSAEVEQQNSNLANLYVASYRLHGTLDRKEVIEAIQEIIANLIGSEEAALFELEPATGMLKPIASFGLSPEECRPVALGQGHLGRAAETGQVFVADPGAPPSSDAPACRLTAAVPLILDGKVTGAIAIYRLLPQKAGVEELDRELFDLLANHAATALYCTALHAKHAAAGAGR